MTKKLKKKLDDFFGLQIQPTVQISHDNKQINSSNPSILPPLMQKLNTLCKAKGFMGVGKTSLNQSPNIIGRYWDKQTNLIMPFPQQKKVPSLNFNQTFQALSGQAINAWNNYAQKQTNLKAFMNQISTSQKRSQWLEDQIQNLTLVSFRYKWIVLLYYAYVYQCLPFQKPNTELKFLNESKVNFLCLSQSQQQQLFKKIQQINGKSINYMYSQLTQLIQKFRDRAVSNKFYLKQQKLAKFYILQSDFMNNIAFYLQKHGLTADQIAAIIGGAVQVNQKMLKQNTVKKQIQQYLSFNTSSSNKKNGNQITLDLPLYKSSKQRPKWSLIGNQQYAQQLSSIFQGDLNLREIMFSE